jgi:hypothetical protein
VPSHCDTSRTHPRCAASRVCRPSRSFPRTPSHQLVKTEVAPSWLLLGLRGALDTISRVLVGHNVVFVLGINGLQVRRDVDVFWREIRGSRVRK